ncbi:MAG: hydroxyacylglutathione hydrolase [Gammaproteobacteria bacterium]|nr:hydroxyacylglutathione hydrolase [Gammaproteobacteria bacterium]
MQPTPLAALSDNYIWTLEGEGGRFLVVDPGDAGPVLAAARDGREPAAVVLTHHHHDHIGGVPALLERWPELPVYAPDDERIPMATARLRGGQSVDIAQWRFEVIDVPGHTRSHIALHGHGILFSGDTLFSLGCGRLFEGTPSQMLESLDRLARLPAATLVCCGHEYTRSNAAFALAVEPGNQALRERSEEVERMREQDRPTVPSTLGSELACNPFLRIDAPDVVRAVGARAGDGGAVDRVARFAALRAWKDGFGA